MANLSTDSNVAPAGGVSDTLVPLFNHYNRGVQEMNTNRTRKNGWNEIINAYMGRLPANWPYQSVVVDPRIRTVILEKTARLLNAKLQGRLIPREDSDIIKARINNAILAFQWDNANVGGSMIEKIANADQITRLFGSAYAWVYWNAETECNEIKIIDPRDIWWDGGATHVRNAQWCQIREWVTLENLDSRGYDTKELKKRIQNGVVYSNDLRSTAYESIEKVNRFVEDRLGQDPFQSTIEFITEWHNDSYVSFVPRRGLIVKMKKQTKEKADNPYKHKRIPAAQLRYYPLGDNMQGDSEVESVLPLFRAINATLCGYIDEMNIAMRPPLMITSAGVRMETIEYGPGAKWIMNTIGNVQEANLGRGSMEHFHETYPALVAAFNTAMGQESLGVSSTAGQGFTDKTATEVRQITAQANSRDQYNQLYLGEFLKDIMMMWLANNQQFIFDDPTKTHYLLKIVDKDEIQQLQQGGLDETETSNDTYNQLAQTITESPNSVSQADLNGIVNDTAMPSHPVITNPNEKDPLKFDIHPKLELKNGMSEANLYVTKEDMNGFYDYIPDVRSMSLGAGAQMQQARDKAIELVQNPQITQQLTAQGYQIKMKDILENTFEDAGYSDAEALFQPINQGGGAGNPNQPGLGQPGLPGQGGIPGQLPGAGFAQAGPNTGGLPPVGGLPQIPQAVPSQPQFGGLS